MPRLAPAVASIPSAVTRPLENCLAHDEAAATKPVQRHTTVTITVTVIVTVTVTVQVFHYAYSGISNQIIHWPGDAQEMRRAYPTATFLEAHQK